MSFHLSRQRSRAILASLVVGVLLTVCAPAWALSKGQLDTSFGSAGFASLGSNTRLLATAVQSDGKVVAVGASGVDSGGVHLLVVRFTSSGQLDSSFSGGRVTGPANVVGHAVAIQSDGKIVVAGKSTDSSGSTNAGVFVERFNSNGSVDGGFGSGGMVTTLTGAGHGEGNAVAMQGNEIVVAGDGSITNGPLQDQGFPGVAIVRISSTGHVDSSSVNDLGRYSIATGVAIQPDGKIVIGGTQRGDLQTTQTLAARFNSNGSRDNSFAGGGFVHQYTVNAGYSGFNAVALQPDGKVVLAGAALNGNTGINMLVVRLTSGGSPDGSFGSGGAVQLPASKSAQAASSQNAPYGALGLVVAGGGIFTAGWYDNFGQKQLALWGLTGSGSPDSGFGTGGRTLISSDGNNIQGNGFAIAPDGRLLVAGEVDTVFPPASAGFEARFGGPTIAPPIFKPVISRVSARPTRFRAANKGGSTASSGGMKITYNDSQASRMTFTVLQALPGVKRGKRCVAPPKRKRSNCTRIVIKGSFTHNDSKGTNTVHFTGRVRGHKLAPGSYTLRLVPVFQGHVGRSTTLSFRIIR